MLGKLLRAAFGLALLVPGLAFAQSATISGTVTDANGETLIGANVLIEQLVIGAATDLDGRYTFEVPAGQVRGQTVTLRAGFIGYTPQARQITLNPGPQTQNFELQLDLLRLDEVVVTGVTGATPTKKLAFTVDKLDASALELAPGANPVGSMQGKVAGASVVSNGGAPGEGLSVRLRGSTSLTGTSAPLYIVDGVILGSNQVDIDALDIESMEIVKGAAASSLYGSRAQNGVINITTKRGSAIALNQTRVTIRNEFGINQLPKDLKANQSHNYNVNAQGQFLNAAGEVNDCDTCTSLGYGPGVLVDRTDKGASFFDNPYVGETFNAFEQFFDPGNTYSNHISVSQNSAKTNFHASFTNYDEAGVLVGLEGYNRRSFRINLDHRLSNNLFFSTSGFYSQSTSDSPNSSINQGNADFNPFFGLMFTSPLSDLTAKDDTGELLIQPDPLSVEENPLYVIQNADLFNDRSRILGSFRARYTPAPWVDVETNMSYDRSDRDNREFYDRGFQSVDPSSINDGRIVRRNDLDEAINADLTVSVRKQFDNLTTRSQLKYQIERNDLYSEAITASTLTAAGIPDLSNANGDKNVSSSSSSVRSEGYYATFGVDYADKYIADFLLRRDGSSLFGEDERWHNYFRVSGAYRVSEELWWPLQDELTEFKLRYSYGTAGGRPRFEAQYETFSLSSGNISKGTLGNTFLKPELSAEQEFGVDIGFFDKVFAELVYAKTSVEDQLLQVPLAGYFGFSSQWQNAGSLESNTIEAQISANILRSRNTSLDVGFVFDRTRQKITEFNTNAYRTGPQSAFYFRADEKLGSMYGIHWLNDTGGLPADVQSFAGQFQTNDDGYLVWVGDGNSWQDGISKDLWGTTSEALGTNGRTYRWGIPIKFLDAEESTFGEIGNTIPDFNLGFNTTLRWKGITAYMLWNAQIGGDVYNFTKQWSYRDGRASDQDQGTKSDQEKKSTDYYEVLYDATAVNDHFFEDGTYVKLRELSLGYTLNRVQLQKMFGNLLNSVSFSVIGRNLLTFSDYTGFDPEVGSGDDATLYRVDNFGYPKYRTFTGKIELQF